MTVPQPASEDRGGPLSAHDPWAPPPEHSAPSRGQSPEERRTRRRADIADAAGALVLTAVIGGVLLGLLWWWLAPRVPLVTNGEALYAVNSESEEAIAADGTFLFLALGAGAVAGAVAFLVRRYGGVLLVLGLATGSLAAAVLGWRLGVWLSPGEADVVERARELGAGGQLDAPLVLHAKVALLAFPFAALGAHAAATAIWGPKDELAPAPRR